MHEKRECRIGGVVEVVVDRGMTMRSAKGDAMRMKSKENLTNEVGRSDECYLGY
jgi:hypothetical protein